MGGDLRMWIDKDMAQYLQRTLSLLPVVVSGKVIRQASRQAMKPVIQTARANAPVSDDPEHSGTLRRSIGYVQKTYRNSGIVYTIVGARKKYDSQEEGGHKPTKISHLVERGVKPHRIIRRSKSNAYNYNVINHPGVKATYFMRKAYDSHKNDILSAFTASVHKGIKKEAIRLAGKLLQRKFYI